MAALERELVFQRQALHPEFNHALEHLLDKLPPRTSTLIRAASEYPRTDLPWTIEPNGTHELCVEGYPSEAKFYVTVSPTCVKPEKPYRLGAHFALKPPPGIAPHAAPASVIGTFGGELETDTFGLGGLVDMAAQTLTEVYGDLQPPWDTVAGRYNHHDEASLARFRREMPALDDKFHEYFMYDNILDEFEGSGGPWVLFNFIGEVRIDALKKYPHLHKLYKDVAAGLTTETDVTDANGNYWMRSGFDHGKVWFTFMVRDGRLSAFAADYHPVGTPMAFQNFRSGFNRTRSWVHVRSLGMTFGLDNLNFTNYFTRDDSMVSFDARMDSVPTVVAPPGIEQGAELVAGKFMRTLAQGAGGMHSQVSSKAARDGTVRFSSEVTAELIYSPALEFFAKLGDSLADENNEKVRTEERRLAEEFLDAFVKDYNNARGGILALDRDPAFSK